jgi:hypothetical protein
VTTSSLNELAQIAAKHASLLRTADKGGRDRMVAFEMLIHRLAVAYEEAKERPAAVTYNHHQKRHGGPFVRVVNVLLPIVDKLAATSGRPLAQPATEYARGQKIRTVLGERRKAKNSIAPSNAL